MNIIKQILKSGLDKFKHLFCKNETVDSNNTTSTINLIVFGNCIMFTEEKNYKNIKINNKKGK